MTSQIERMSEMSAVLKEVMTTSPAAEGALPEVPPVRWAEGVDALVHLLRYPEKIHAYNLSALPSTSRYTVDWLQLPETFRAMFEHNETRCVDAYMKVRLALAVLSLEDVPLCPGPLGVDLWQDDCCFQYVTIEICADVNSYRAHCLTEALQRLAFASDIRGVGFLVNICSIHPWNPEDWPPRATLSIDDDDDEDEE
ncbi:hypothetical protein CDL60_28830 [Roseateles noduli]|nr:hypothetical protein CDL60_28830 [Roseateles noduli]